MDNVCSSNRWSNIRIVIYAVEEDKMNLVTDYESGLIAGIMFGLGIGIIIGYYIL